MLSHRSPLIVTMHPTRSRDLPDESNLRPLYRPRHRTIHGQRPVRAPVMVILEVTGEEPPQTLPVQDHHVVQALATGTPDEPLHVGVLPGTSGGDPHVFDSALPSSRSCIPRRSSSIRQVQETIPNAGG
jgi:hypothetical protein